MLTPSAAQLKFRMLEIELKGRNSISQQQQGSRNQPDFRKPFASKNSTSHCLFQLKTLGKRGSYRSVVLHDGVVQLLSLRGAAG